MSSSSVVPPKDRVKTPIVIDKTSQDTGSDASKAVIAGAKLYLING